MDSRETLWARRRTWRRTWLLCGTALLAVLGSHPGRANEAPVPAAGASGQQSFNSRKAEFDIPAGPLEPALKKWAATSKLTLLAPSDHLNAVSTEGVTGSHTPEEALKKLLKKTALRYAQTGPRSVAVYDPAARGALAQATPLPQITVEGTREGAGQTNPNSTMTSPPPYAGGQVARGGQVGILGNRDFMNTPFNQNNYTAQVVQNQQARFLTEALNNDPSVVAMGSRTVGTDFFSIRGFGVVNFDVLYNGLQGVAPGGNDATILTESFERIEVLKGPSSLLNGIVGNVGGSINLVPKRAGDIPLIQFTPDYSMNSQFGGHLDAGRRFGDNKEFGVRFNGVYRDGDTPVDHLSRQTGLAALGLDYRGERLRLDGDFGYQKAKVQGVRRFTRMAAGVQVPDAPDNHTNWFHPAEFTEAEVLYGSSRGEFDVTDRLTVFAAVGGSESFQTRFSSNRTINSVLGTLSGGNFPGDATLTKYDALTWLAGLRGRLETGLVQHQFVFAYNVLERTTSNSLASGAPSTPFPPSNIYNPIYGAWPNYLTPSFGDVRKANDITHSSFVVADTLSVFEERLQLTVGARLQEIKANNFNAATGALNSGFDESAISPSVGLVVKPWQNVSLYANYIQGLQTPVIAPNDADNRGQVFPPHKAEQYETGVKVDFGRVATTLAFYQIALPNAYTNPSTNIFGIDGEQRHRGIDLNVFGEVAPGVRVLGGVAYIDSVLLNTAGGIDDGNRGIGVPIWRGVFGAEWDTPFIPGFTLTGRLIRNGSVYVDTANLQRLPAWTRVDIGGRYLIERPNNQPIIVRATIDNVLDSSHWEATNNILVLSEPRTFKVSTTFTY